MQGWLQTGFFFRRADAQSSENTYGFSVWHKSTLLQKHKSPLLPCFASILAGLLRQKAVYRTWIYSCSGENSGSYSPQLSATPYAENIQASS